MSRRNNINDMTVCEQIMAVKNDFCENRCKHYEEAIKKRDEALLSGKSLEERQETISKIQEELNDLWCNNCPLARL